MQIVVQSRLYRSLAIILCLFCALTYISISVDDSVAYQLASSEQRRSLEQAVTLAPANAEYRNRLAYYLMFSEQRPDLAIPMYESAVGLNSHIAEYWLDLASAYEATGAREHQEYALARAIEVDPHTPLISREVATAFFVRGDLQKAFRLFRVVLQNDPSEMEPTLTMCWQATRSLDAMKEVLPSTSTAYLAFLNLLVSEHNTEAVEITWSRLIALRESFDPQLTKPFLDYLITQRQVEAVRAAWDDLARINTDLRPYRLSPTNLVVNSGFEQKLLNMGFDWQYVDLFGVRLAVDSEQFHRGSHSLSISFDGEPVLDAGVFQLIAVEPSTRYNFRIYVKSDNICAAHGPQFVISNAYTKTPLLITDEVLGTTNWKQLSGSFTTDQSTEMVVLKVMRFPGAGLITGRLWIDDVVLARE